MKSKKNLNSKYSKSTSCSKYTFLASEIRTSLKHDQIISSRPEPFTDNRIPDRSKFLINSEAPVSLFVTGIWTRERAEKAERLAGR